MLGFVGAGSQGPQGGRWGMVRSEGILLCRLPLSDIIMPPHWGLAGVSQPGFLPSVPDGMLHESFVSAQRAVLCAETGRSIHALSLILSH